MNDSNTTAPHPVPRLPSPVPQDALPHIPAQHNALAEELIYRFFVRWPLWSHFDRVWLKIEGPLPNAEAGPLIGYLNHSSWWDGYIPLLLHRTIFRRAFQNYLMMDERQLRSYRFFSWIGVFSIDPRDRAESLRSVNYIARVLRERRDRMFWLFPQGKLLPNDRRPFAIYPGLARIIVRAGGATLWPVALRYEFRNEQRPELFIRAGPPQRVEATERAHALTALVQRELTHAADTLRDDVLENRLGEYVVLMNGRPGINRLFDVLLRVLPRRARREG